MKIDLTKQSGTFLVHKLANELEKHINLNVYFDYNWRKLINSKNQQFDLVLFDNELNIKAMVKIDIQNKLPVRTINFGTNSLILKFSGIFKECVKENIPVFWINLNENNLNKVVSDILERLI